MLLLKDPKGAFTIKIEPHKGSYKVFIKDKGQTRFRPAKASISLVLEHYAASLANVEFEHLRR